MPKHSAPSSTPTRDAGWTANSTAGDKTSALVAHSVGLDGTMISALNVVSANTGTKLALIETNLILAINKIAALETALVAGKLPNA